jgi:hypothetical protein
MMPALSAAEALDRYFLEARSKLLDVAAILDRIDRGGKIDDPRLDKTRQALAVLRMPVEDRAEQIQQIFSLSYDSNWLGEWKAVR